MAKPNIAYRRNLPHFHPDGFSIFVTFRLADSLPVEILAQLKTQREEELKAIKTNSIDERYNAEKRHFGRYDDWLDRCEHGSHWLQESRIARIIADKMHELDQKSYRLLTYCIMPNHVHLLFEPLHMNLPDHQGKSAKYPVTDMLRLIKGGTARECNLILKRDGRFWSHESYDHYVRNEGEMARIIRYIINNPVKAGLEKDWTDWPYTYASPEIGRW